MGLLSSTLAQLKSLHPNLEVELREQMQLMQDVTSGELDAAVVVERQWPELPGLLWTPCYDEALTVIANSGVASPDTPSRACSPRSPSSASIAGRRPARASTASCGACRWCRRSCSNSTRCWRSRSWLRKNAGFTVAPLLKNFNWESDPSLCILQMPGRPVARRVGMLENGRRSHITTVVREEMLAHLRRMKAAS